MSVTSTIVDRAEIRFHAAAPELQPYVGCFWVITAQSGATVRAVPDGTTSISIELQQEHGFEGYLRGPMLQPLELRFSAPATVIGVRLRPGVAFMLSGVPAHSMADHRTRLDDCAAFSEFTSLEPVPRTCTQWIAALQKFLIARLDGATLHPVVARALAAIHAEQGSIAVADIAARCGSSERHLGRLMRDWIGYGAKRYSGIVRFQAALMQMESAPSLPFATLASQIGYFDQAHLSVDVARYAGATPGHLKSEHVADFSKTRCDVPF
jgi:AraC-like DNA-binding protein